MRALRIGSTVLLVLLITLAGTLAFVARSPAAAAWLAQRATPMVPGELLLADVSGNLAEGLRLVRVEYRLDEFELRASDVRLRLAWTSLLRGELKLSSVQAKTLTVSQLAGEPSAEPFSLPEISLPLAIRVDALRIDRLDLNVAGLEERVTDLRARARWQGSQLELKRLAATWRDYETELLGEADFSGGWPLSVSLDWQSVDARLAGGGEIAGDLDRLELHQQLRSPVVAELAGVVAQLPNAPSLDLLVQVPLLELPAGEGRTVELRDSRLELSGPLDAYRARLTANLATAGMPDADLAATAGGDLKAVVADRIELRTSPGMLEGQARIRFSPLIIDGEFAGRGWNPAELFPDWPGNLDFRGGLRADASGDFRLRINQLGGSLRDLPLAGRALLQRTGERLALEEAELLVGDNRLLATLAIEQGLNGRFELEAGDLSSAWPGLAGRLTGTGQFAGTLEQPLVRAQLSGEEIRYQDQAIAALELELGVDADQQLDLVVDARGLRSGALGAGDLELSVRGLLGDFETRFSVDGGPLRAQLAGRGAWDGRLRQTVSSGELEADGAGLWLLASPFALSLSANGAKFDAHCWQQDVSSLCVDDLLLSGDKQRAGARLSRLPLSLFAGLLGAGFSLEGTADAEFVYTREAEDIGLTLDWRQNGTLLRFDAQGDEVVETAFDGVQLRLEADAAQAQLRGRVTGDYGLSVELGGTVTEPLAADAGLDLSLIARLPDLSLPAPLIARYLPLERPGGRIDVDLRVTGTRDYPSLDGFAQLTEGRAFLPQAGIDIESLEFALRPGSGDELGRVSGSAQSGGGRVQVDGVLKSAPERGLYLEARLSGDGFEAVRFPNQVVYVSPDLELIVDQQLVQVRGRVTVPRARIEVEQLPESAQTPSEDIVVHYEIEPVEPRRRAGIYQVVGSLDLVLGDDVALRGFGLDTRLGGQLKLTRATVADPFRADGSLRTIGGKFTAARRELSIDRGVLIFTGPLDDPSVDVRAVREVAWEGRDYRAGVRLTGPVSEIKTEVFGEPAMSETDALSFLVMGRPASDLSGSASTKVNGTAVALGLVGLLPITEQLQETLMLDEISFSGGGSDDTSVVAGKRLSDEIFVRYTYGLFDRIGTFLIRYEVGRGFSLEAGSGREQTLEVIYSIDR